MDGGVDSARRRVDHRDQRAGERLVADRPVERGLEHAGNALGNFENAEQQGVGGADGPPVMSSHPSEFREGGYRTGRLPPRREWP